MELKNVSEENMGRLGLERKSSVSAQVSLPPKETLHYAMLYDAYACIYT